MRVMKHCVDSGNRGRRGTDGKCGITMRRDQGTNRVAAIAMIPVGLGGRVLVFSFFFLVVGDDCVAVARRAWSNI